jgi:hypothetical protein
MAYSVIKIQITVLKIFENNRDEENRGERALPPNEF